MNIILLNPPSPFLINQKAFPPLGLLYLASQAREAGHEVNIKDLAGEEASLEESLSHLKGDLFGITASTPQYPMAKRMLKIVRRYNPQSLVAIGGAHASSVPDRCVEDGFASVVVGEGERALLKIASTGQSGIIQEPYIRDIDDIPEPARDMIDIGSYGYAIDTGLATTAITSRGCPFQCAFCSKDVWQRGTRYHSVERIVKEIHTCIDDFGFRQFLFLDDSLTLNPKRLMALCRAIEPLKISWRAYVRADGTTPRMLLAMKQAGCNEIGIGVESGSQKILDVVCKGVKVEQNSLIIRQAKELGIVTNAFILIGLPGESYKTVEETRHWMEENQPDKFGYNIFAPYFGTPVYTNPSKYDITIHPMPDDQSWVKGRRDSYQAFVSTSELTREEILRLFQESFNYFESLVGWRPGVGHLGKKVC